MLTELQKHRRKAMADKLLESLTEQEIRTLQKFNPFVIERNELIRKLRAKGVQYPVISLVSGISRTQTVNIVMGYAQRHKKQIPKSG